MGFLSELNSVEKPVAIWLSKMGWTPKSHNEFKAYKRPFSNPILTPIATVQFPQKPTGSIHKRNRPALR